MPDALDTLKSEHRLIERGLRALDRLCADLERGEQVPPEAFSQLLDFIRSFADRYHHAKEEAHLFPALVQHGVSCASGPIGCMLYEHEIGRQLVGKMAAAATACQAGDAEGAPEFVASSRQYIGLLTQHIQKEDNVLFRITEQLLSEQDMASLGDAFEQADAESGITRQQYERIIMALEGAGAAEPATFERC